VFVFLHGGGFREGDRAQYGYVAKPFAKHGIVTVVASYRLTPEFTYPDQPNDTKQMLEWVFHHIESYGGDPSNIYVGGHSAGAALTADVCVDREWLEERSLPPDLIKGCVPISGSYDLRSDSRREYIPDPTMRAAASPILNIEESPPPSIVAVGSVEQQLEPSREFVKRLREKRGHAELLVLEGMEHDEAVAALGSEHGNLFQAILGMIKGNGVEE
jgi:acetyl esterase/lipase